MVVVHNYNVNNDVAVDVTKKFSKSTPIHTEHQPIYPVRQA